MVSGPIVALLASALATREPLAIAVPGARPDVRARPLRTLGCGVLHGALWTAAVLRWDGAAAVVHAALFSVLLVVSVIDVEHSRIPDRISLPTVAVAAAVALGAALSSGAGAPLVAAMVGAACFFGGLGAAHLISPRGMGRGDVKLAATLGLALGWEAAAPTGAVALVLAAFFAASAVGTVVGVVLLVRRRRNAPYPFGPSLVAGTVAVLLLSGALTAG